MKDAVDRREFLRFSAGAAGATVVSGVVPTALAAIGASQAINPSIPDTRAVCGYDEGMVTNKTATGTMAAQNAAVNAEKVFAVMDNMAKALAGKSTAAEAWRTIFRLPASKTQWSDVGVAIKVNCQTQRRTARAAVVGKVCRELVALGVQPGKIRFYDGISDSDAANGGIQKLYGPFVGNEIPTGVQPVFGTMSDWQTADILRDGSAQLLINIASNASHSSEGTGYATLTMKNHLGSFKPDMFGTHDSMPNLLGMTKQARLITGNPPLQQLCIVDSLWAGKSVKAGTGVDCAPCRIIMGTFSPVVDYQTVKKVREEKLGSTHSAGPIGQILPAFSLQESQLEWQEVTGTTAITGRQPDRPLVSFRVVSTRGGSAVFLLSEGMPYQVRITTAGGRIVRRLAGVVSARQDHAVWDWRNDDGRTVAPGFYFAECVSGGVLYCKALNF